LNTAPASHNDWVLFQQELRKTAAEDLNKKEALAATSKYLAGDLETDAEYYRIHFRATVRQPELLERVVRSLRLSVTSEGIRKARAIMQRLYDETWLLSEYSLLPQLSHLTIPTLIISGDYDFIPVACAVHIAQTIPGARLVVLKDCGHFSYLKYPDQVCKEIADLFSNH
jgi:pimeloyl-ACP methyl ester carboxylesterase